MDAVDRLAAYLAGELDAAERSALEAELDRDPVLRASLDAMRRADEHLTALSSPTPPAGFEDRLQAVLDAELEVRLGAAPGSAHDDQRATAPAPGHDELAARRERRAWWQHRGLVPALGGVAAASVLLVAGISFLGLPGGTDDAADEMVAMDALEADGAERGEAALGGPVVVRTDRALTDEDLDALLDADPLAGLAAEGLDPAAGAGVADAFAAQLQAGPAALAAPSDDAADTDAPVTQEDAPAAESPDEEAATDDAAGAGAAGLDDDAVLAACVAQVLDASDAAIPAYVEFASFGGEPVVVVGLLTIDPGTGHYTRTEIWVLARSDCQVLRFSQR